MLIMIMTHHHYLISKARLSLVKSTDVLKSFLWSDDSALKFLWINSKLPGNRLYRLFSHIIQGLPIVDRGSRITAAFHFDH